jgi:ATP-grasp domain
MTNSKKKQSRLPVIVAPDRTTAKYLKNVFVKASLPPRAIFAKERDWANLAGSAVKTPSTVIIVPSPSLGTGLIDLALTGREAGSVMLGWGSGKCQSAKEIDDQWCLERLLEQHGVSMSSNIEALIEAARILFATSGKIPNELPVRGQQNALSARLKTTIGEIGLQKKRAQKDIATSLSVTPSGEIKLNVGRTKTAMGSPSSIAEALSLLVKTIPNKSSVKEPAPDPSPNEIALIARPPARVLSETTSKRLTVAFGIGTPREHLCRSANEATKFAASLRKPAVCKLVRPALKNKQSMGAVVTDVMGSASVRRAVHRLESIAASLGPPDALGILVSEQVDGGARVWLKMLDHDKFGRLLLVGAGDSPNHSPRAALTCPVSAVAASAALNCLEQVPPTDLRDKLACGIARFSQLVAELGSHIDQAEISPIVATDDEDDALALDALISVYE